MRFRYSRGGAENDSGLSLVPVSVTMAEWLFMGAVLALPIYILADAGSTKGLCQPEDKEPKLISPAANPQQKPGADVSNTLFCPRQLVSFREDSLTRVTAFFAFTDSIDAIDKKWKQWVNESETDRCGLRATT